MTAVLDTNVVSELMRPTPDPAVLAWFHTLETSSLRTTAITVAEIGYGVERLPEGRRRHRLAAAATEVFRTFSDQVLAFDSRAALAYGGIVRERELAGRPIEGFDAQIAAIAAVHGATLATRNTADFDGTGVPLVDPWSE